MSSSSHIASPRDHCFMCDCCDRVYECMFYWICKENGKCSQQAERCSATVHRRVSKDTGSNEKEQEERYFITCHYGSDYDCVCFVFRRSSEQVRASETWINKETGLSTNVCDDCIAEMLRDRVIIVHRSDGGVYPCVCDVCERLYETVPPTEEEASAALYESRSECCTETFKLRGNDKEWAFCTKQNTFLYFSNLKDDALKCLKPHGRVCDTCFAEFENRYGPSRVATDQERGIPPANHNDDDTLRSLWIQ